MTKAIFFDIDGTLVSFRTHRVSPALLADLHRLRDRGIKLFIATGRHPGSIGPAAGLFPFDGFITLNGQYCFAGDQVLHRAPIDAASIARQVELLEATHAPCLFLTESETLYVNPGPRASVFPRQLNLPLPAPVEPRQVLGQEIYQMTAFFSPEEERAAGARFFPGLEVMRWHPDFVDVIAAGGGKDRGVDVILEHFGFERSQSMAFGDGENDLPMLRRAGIGVAMGSASEAVQAGADWTCGTVDEDGICTALRRFGVLD